MPLFDGFTAPKNPPDDVIFEVSKVMDDVRGVLAEVGLRPVHTWLIVERFSGAERNEGTLTDSVFTKLEPPPVVRPLSAARIAASGGMIHEGSVDLVKISRSRYTREQLVGLLPAGALRPRNESFFYGLMPVQPAVLPDKRYLELYIPAGEPVLETFGWALRLRPGNRRIYFPA